MTAPLDLSQFVHDALTGPRQVESVKELTRSIADASDAERAALCDEALAALAGVVRICEAVRYEVGLGKNQLERIEAARAVLAKAKSLGGRA